ncbi:MAG: AAA family ATPase [Kofleriaceae bacterium]
MVVNAGLWPGMELADGLARNILSANPWWDGRPGPQLPPVRRDFVGALDRRLAARLAPIVVVRGPRQVGKTTAQLQVIQDLLGRGVDPRLILRVQFDELPSLKRLDEPILRIVEWFQHVILRRTLNEVAASGGTTYLFFDEVQNLRDWDAQLKALVDHHTTRVVVTGSSALRIEAGRDSLAGRIHSLDVGTLKLNEISAIRFGTKLEIARPENSIEDLLRVDFWKELRELGAHQQEGRDAVFSAFAERGGYPLVHEHADVPWDQITGQLNETVINRVIQHDLRLGDRGRRRDPDLLKELFRLACRYAGQSPGTLLFQREIQRVMSANVGAQRVRQYLDFLDRTLLLRMVEPLEIRLKKRKGDAKLCLADHGLRASWLGEVVPLTPDGLRAAPESSSLAGRIAESVAGSYLKTNLGAGDLRHVPARPDQPEIDFVLVIGTQRIPIEIKYQRRIDPQGDTEGLRSFIERAVNRAPFGVLVTQSDDVLVPDPRIVTLPLSSLLLLR